MKIHWYTYLLGLCAMLLGSCAGHDMAVEHTPEKVTSRELPICFVSSFVDHAVTRHANELCEHLPTMGVWGWSTGLSETEKPLFFDQKVTHNNDSARWEYSPLQYWQNGCSYQFFAYAPHQNETDATVSIDSLTHMISIKNVTLHGHNLQATPTDTTKELFRDTPETDWMISRAGQTAIGTAGMDVEFTMQHILGKLNIRIKGGESLLARPYIKSVTVDSIVVGSLPSQGDFTQQLTHTPVMADPNDAAVEEWTVQASDLQIKCTQPCTLALTPTYLVESLVIPHHVDASSMVELYYTYHFTDGNTEQCRYRLPLTEAFTRFVSGYNHTLTFTVCSKRIVFEAGANDWVKEDEERED